ncbi:MAG: hypothetical protein WC969_06790 [Elusimicrobiota bacterium]
MNAPAGRRLFWEWFAVFLGCAALCSYYQFQTPYIPCADGYFHIEFARLMREHGLFRHGFPWAYFSFWRDGFSDGSPLYHLLLIPFTFGDRAFGVKLATVLLSALVFSSFYAILGLNGVRARVYWFWLLLVGGFYFWWRMEMPRPQVLSVLLLLWSLHFLLNGRLRPFAALSFVYPLSYVAAFLPQAFAVLRWAYLKATERRSEHAVVLAGLGAFALAFLVHPYFPKNLEFFYAQIVEVMRRAVMPGVDLHLGKELGPLDTRVFVGAHLPLVVHLLGLGFAFMHRRTPLSERTRVLFPIMLLLLFLSAVSNRFLEYAVPVATLFCAFLFTDLAEGLGEADLRRKLGTAFRPAAAAWLLAMGATCAVETAVLRNVFAGLPEPSFERLSRALAAKAPAGELVYTCDWDATPELFFFNPQHRYFVMLDPTFMYYWDPALWRKWEGLRRLPAEEAANTLVGTFGTRFGACQAVYGDFRRTVGSDKRFRILDEDRNGYVFEVVGKG